ncbi:MAG: YcxB family protein [Ruminococcus sp.]|nr:YcxB family protein [Ruminococcus sp.]MCD7799877.1 YcxB family protein [Ruminococcus sp.]
MRNKLFQVTTQPTLKMYKKLNKMNSQRSISLRFFLVLSCMLGVFGVYSIVRYILDTSVGGLGKGIFGILINIAFVVFYLKGHELLAEKSMRMQGKDAYLEIFSTFYDDRVNVRTSKTKGSIPLKCINRLYEDNQYYYLSYDNKNVAKSYIVIDKDGFTLGDSMAFKEFINKKISLNRENRKKMKKLNRIGRNS